MPAQADRPRWRSGLVLLLFLVVLGFVGSHVAAETEEADEPYRYRSYAQTMKYFSDLERDYPDLVETFIAQDEFPAMLPNKDGNWASCEGAPCKTLVVRIGNKKLMTTTTPELYFSGAVHGDERLGPLVVTELAGFLCKSYVAGDVDVQRLVDTRATWITPMTNPQGFAENHREENSMDPNRDFPYLQDAAHCMTTQTARVVNELFRRHLFQYMITFHGGMRALTYEWGSMNHMVGSKSTEAPDDRAFAAVGRTIQADAGKDKRGNWWYPLGPINDLVYPVNGGLEDFSYAAGWEESPSPISVCRPKTYGGYDEERTKYKPGSIATLLYLAEMDDYKTPPADTLGRKRDMRRDDQSQGGVARNMKMCLRLIELTLPELVIQPVLSAGSWPKVLKPGSSFSVQAYGFGCLTISTVELLLLPKGTWPDCSLRPNSFQSPEGRKEALQGALSLGRLEGISCRGLSIWSKPDPGSTGFRFDVDVPPNITGEFCVALAAEFDQDWGQQLHPDPSLRPQTHAARTRVDEHYTAEANEGEMRLEEYRVKLFPVSLLPTTIAHVAWEKVTEAPSEAPAIETATSTAWEKVTEAPFGAPAIEVATSTVAAEVMKPPSPAPSGTSQGSVPKGLVAAPEGEKGSLSEGTSIALPEAEKENSDAQGSTSSAGVIVFLSILVVALIAWNTSSVWKLRHRILDKSPYAAQVIGASRVVSARGYEMRPVPTEEV